MFKFSASQIGLVAALLLTAAPGFAATDYAPRIAKVLRATPLIDGHNDWAEQLRDRFGEKWWAVDLQDTRALKPPMMTDVNRLRQGQVGGQFWSVFVPAGVTGPAAVEATLQQIDIIRGIVAKRGDVFELASTAADVRRIHKAGKIASMMGVEGGSQIDNNLAVLRSYYALGARYMTLTHVRNNDWADSSNAAPAHNGLSAFGKQVVGEMNRLGMLVDLSHVSPATMKVAIATSKAPVIFSHSSARALDDHPRNVPDDVLALLPAHDGVVMINYAPAYVSQANFEWEAERAAARAKFSAGGGGVSPAPNVPFSGLYIGQPERAKAAMDAWEAAHPMPRATLAQVADHIDHVVKIAGHDHVGLGADLDGIDDTPDGLSDVSTYPALLGELMARGWSDADIAKLAGGNVLRVMEKAEAVAASLKGAPVPTGTIAEVDAK